MSTLIADPIASVTSSSVDHPNATLAPTVQALYTICPVFVASNIAVEFGWLDEEFAKIGASAVYLRSLTDNAGWIPHYRHSRPQLFRDGGAYPTIWAKADLTNTTLIALTGTQAGGQLLVRVDSGIRRIEDLRGRRVGLTQSQNAEKIDFARATAQRGIEFALAQGGLKPSDVQWVNLAEADSPNFTPARRPSELWSQYPARNSTKGTDIEASETGQIDAFYSHAGRTAKLVETGRFTVIADLSRSSDWRAQLANGPFTTAVNTEFAKEHPEVVVAFLRAAIRAGRWINANRDAAAEIFQRVTFNPDLHVIRSAIAHFDFLPNLSEKNLLATHLNKEFLRSHGYVKNDFDVKTWANDSFLRQAHASLDR